MSRVTISTQTITKLLVKLLDYVGHLLNLPLASIISICRLRIGFVSLQLLQYILEIPHSSRVHILRILRLLLGGL